MANPCAAHPKTAPQSVASRTALRPTESEREPIIGAQKKSATGYTDSTNPYASLRAEPENPGSMSCAAEDASTRVGTRTGMTMLSQIMWNASMPRRGAENQSEMRFDMAVCARNAR